MKKMFDDLSTQCSRNTTRMYSTSFSLGIRFLHQKFHNSIYGIYGFVRVADEIVDSFHNYDKNTLLQKFITDTERAIRDKISLNPILNSFQHIVHEHQIPRELIDQFFKSMQTDLEVTEHTEESIQEYIFGSAEVVGLMCLKVFTEGNNALYESLKPAAMKLGSAFQKVNFLRDAGADFSELNRNYFPAIQDKKFTAVTKKIIEDDIEMDFLKALDGIRRLPQGARGGVYLAYFYYRKLFKKIQRSTAEAVLTKRIRINNGFKILCMFNSYFRHQLNIL